MPDPNPRIEKLKEANEEYHELIADMLEDGTIDVQKRVNAASEAMKIFELFKSIADILKEA